MQVEDLALKGRYVTNQRGRDSTHPRTRSKAVFILSASSNKEERETWTANGYIERNKVCEETTAAAGTMNDDDKNRK